MSVRIYRHAVTGREMRVLDGTRASRLVEADRNWSEIKPEAKESGDGARKPARRGGTSRKKSQS